MASGAANLLMRSGHEITGAGYIKSFWVLFDQLLASAPAYASRKGVLLCPRNAEEVLEMRDKLLRRREVEEVTGMSRSTIYRKMDVGFFPRPVKIGPSAVRWKESDIAAWLESLPDAESEQYTHDSS